MNQNRQGLIVFLIGVIGVIAAVSWTLTTIVDVQDASVHKAQEQRNAAALGEENTLVSVRHEGVLPLDEPLNAAWDDAPPQRIDLLTQGIAMPNQDVQTVEYVEVRSLTDGQWIAWRISWDDDSNDSNVDAGRFCDAVAIQFPLSDWTTSYQMGSEKMRVQILHWKALWQKDIDEHFQDVQDLHPNYWVDLYWFADGTGPARLPRVPDDFKSPEALEWFVAQQAGNPMSQLTRVNPVEELIAEGYGSLTPQDVSDSVGRGVHHDGRWHVVIARPISTDDEADYHIPVDPSPDPGQFAVAVWNGSADDVGGRKQYSDWVKFRAQQ